MEFTKNLASKLPPLKFNTPSTIVINDWRLGALNIVLRVLALLYPIITVSRNKLTYMVMEVPTLIPTFWFESSGVSAFTGEPVSLYAAQNVTAQNPLPSYCNNSEYDYNWVGGFVSAFVFRAKGIDRRAWRASARARRWCDRHRAWRRACCVACGMSSRADWD